MADTVKVVDPDNGTGTDYTSLDAWEDATGGVASGDVTALGAGNNAVAKCRSTGGTADTAPVTIDGWTTDADNYIKIWCDPTESYRHLGVWSDSKYRLTVGAETAIANYENYVRVQYLQLSVNGAGLCIRCYNTASSDIRISHCLGKNIGTLGNGFFFYTSVDTNAVTLWNCIAYDFQYGICVNSASAVVTAYNCTTHDCANGYYQAAGSLTLWNCLGDHGGNLNSFPFSGSYGAASDYNASSRSVATDGDHDRVSQTFTFLGAADFHLAENDGGARDYGVSDPGGGLFSDDIDGQTRTGTWDIGADEYMSSSTPLEVDELSDSLINRVWRGII